MGIANLPINTAGKLTADARKNLMAIIESEFTNKESLYHQIQETEKEKIVAAYQKKVNFDKLKKEYERAQKKHEEAEEYIRKCRKAIENLGLNTEGQPDSEYVYDQRTGRHRTNFKAKELARQLEVIEKNAPSMNLKNKLISRLMLATTIGEANEIMREVLGNGIIPATDIKAITFNG